MNTARLDATPPMLTIEEYQRLPDDDLYRDELVRGELVREPRPAQEHASIAARLTSILYSFVDHHGLGVVFGEAGYVLAEDPPTVRGPDISFVSTGRIPPQGFGRGFWRMAPDLAVEIVSPGNSAAEIQEKVLEYLDAGSRLVWVVHPRTRTVVVHHSRSEIRVLGEGEELEGGAVMPGFRVGVGEVFGRQGRFDEGEAAIS